MVVVGSVFLSSGFGAENETRLPALAPPTEAPARSGSIDNAPEAPRGLLDLPSLKKNRVIWGIGGSVGVAGALGLTAFGIYGLSQDFQKGFAASALQNDLACVAGGIVLSSFFSSCLSAILDTTTSP